VSNAEALKGASGSGSGSGDTNTATYTITLPAEPVTLDTATGSATFAIEASKIANLAKGQTVEVSVTNESLKLYAGDSNETSTPTLDLSLSNTTDGHSEAYTGVDSVLASFSENGSQNLTASVDGSKATVAGTYTGTITFKVGLNPDTTNTANNE
jgi:hypothetical protein